MLTSDGLLTDKDRERIIAKYEARKGVTRRAVRNFLHNVPLKASFTQNYDEASHLSVIYNWDNRTRNAIADALLEIYKEMGRCNQKKVTLRRARNR